MGPQAIDALMGGLVQIAGVAGLVYYSINRKWAKDELADKQIGPLRLLIRYRVEVILTIILVPPAWDLLAGFVSR